MEGEEERVLEGVGEENWGKVLQVVVEVGKVGGGGGEEEREREREREKEGGREREKEGGREREKEGGGEGGEGEEVRRGRKVKEFLERRGFEVVVKGFVEQGTVLVFGRRGGGRERERGEGGGEGER